MLLFEHLLLIDTYLSQTILFFWSFGQHFAIVSAYKRLEGNALPTPKKIRPMKNVIAEPKAIFLSRGDFSSKNMMWNLGSGWKSTHWPGTKLKEDVIGVELSWIILSVRPVVIAGESCLRDCMVARCHVMGWSLLASYHRGSEESSGGWRQSSLEKKSFSFSSLPPSPTPQPLNANAHSHYYRCALSSKKERKYGVQYLPCKRLLLSRQP